MQRFVKLKWKIVYDFISTGTQQVVTEVNVVIITVVVSGTRLSILIHITWIKMFIFCYTAQHVRS